MTLSRRRLRHFWVQFHLWPGLLLGAVFALLGLTGSVLCFYPELDLWLNPAQQVTASQPELPGVQRMVDALHAAYPAHHGAWRLEMPLSAGQPINARYYQPPETAGRGFAPLMLTLDPATLKVTSARYWGDYAMTWIYDLHYSLLLERPGRITVGVLGIVCLLSLFSGLYLWWPGRGPWLKAPPAAYSPRHGQGDLRLAHAGRRLWSGIFTGAGFYRRGSGLAGIYPAADRAAFTAVQAGRSAFRASGWSADDCRRQGREPRPGPFSASHCALGRDAKGRAGRFSRGLATSLASKPLPGRIFFAGLFIFG
jgi:hypothetical protein